MARVLKIISVIALMLVLLMPVNSQAFTSFDKTKQQADDFVKKGENSNLVDTSKITDIMLPIGQFLVGIGAVVVIVVTIIMGIKYMGADPNTRAKLKQQLIGLIISAIVIFGAYGIWRIVYIFMDEVV